MAIDTRQKREMAFCFPVLEPLPLPHGAIEVADRIQAAGSYWIARVPSQHRWIVNLACPVTWQMPFKLES